MIFVIMKEQKIVNLYILQYVQLKSEKGKFTKREIWAWPNMTLG